MPITYQLGQIVETPSGTGKVITLDGKEALVRIPPIGAGRYVFMCTDELSTEKGLITAPRGKSPQAAAD